MEYFGMKWNKVEYYISEYYVFENYYILDFLLYFLFFIFFIKIYQK